MVNTFCTSGACLLKAGKDVSTDFTVGTPGGQTATAAIDQLINQAESFINTITGVNYTDTFSGLDDDKKKILEDVASSHVAMAMIQYDIASYQNRGQAQTMLNINHNRVTSGTDLLKEKKASDFVSKT